MPDDHFPSTVNNAASSDPLDLARFTRAVLEENGLDYRDQESHTGVPPSLVYGLAQGQRVPARSVLQFASVAAFKARRPETRQFWEGVRERYGREDGYVSDMVRACPDEEMFFDEAAQVATLFASLRLPESRASVMQLLSSLRAVEVAVVGSSGTGGGESGQT